MELYENFRNYKMALKNFEECKKLKKFVPTADMELVDRRIAEVKGIKFNGYRSCMMGGGGKGGDGDMDMDQEAAAAEQRNFRQ